MVAGANFSPAGGQVSITLTDAAGTGTATIVGTA
jgi:hypothetical protein